MSLRAELRPKWSDFRSERADFRPEMIDFGPEKADLGLIWGRCPKRGGGGGSIAVRSFLLISTLYYAN